MRKKFITFLLSIAILIPTGSELTAKATSLDDLYANGYKKTMNVVSLAKQYGVKPYFNEGESPVKNVVNASKNGLQIKINEARQAINQFPASMHNYLCTLSEILDNYQQPVYKDIVDNINALKPYKKDDIYETYDGWLKEYRTFKKLQKSIIDTRYLVQHLPDCYRNSYSSALDIQQQKLLNTIHNTVMKVVKENNIYSNYYYTKDLVNYLNLQPYFNDNVKNCILNLKNVLNSFAEKKGALIKQPNNIKKTSKYLTDEQLTKLFSDSYYLNSWKNKDDLKQFETIWNALLNGSVNNDRINNHDYTKMYLGTTSDPMNLNRTWVSKYEDSYIHVVHQCSLIGKFDMNYTEDVQKIAENCVFYTKCCVPLTSFLQLYNNCKRYYTVSNDRINSVHTKYKIIRHGDKITVYVMILDWYYLA